MDNTPFLDHRVELLYRNLRLGQAAAILNAGFLVWVAHATQTTIGSAALFLWLGACVLIAALRVLSSVFYQRQTPAQRAQHLQLWYQRLVAGAFASGLAWSVGTVLLMYQQSLSQQLFTGFVMAGMVAGAVPVLAADKKAFRVFAWPVVTTIGICALGPDPIHLAFAVMALIFLAFSTRSADFFHNTLIDSYRLAQDKAGLIEQLKAAQLETELTNRLKTEFLANISHELRTPMNGILGLSDLLDQDELTPSQRELLTPLRASGQELMHLINNLIDLSALEAGKTRLHPAPFALSEFVAALLAEHRTPAQQKGLALIEEVDPNLPGMLVGDLKHLRQIFRHLLNNATRFTEAGHITVSVYLARSDDNTAWLTFSIRDTGPGIPAHVLPRLKGILAQGDGSSNRQFGGLGVGLPIARKLIELMGGQLEIESQEGEGSTFRFTLPFELPPEEADLLALTGDAAGGA